MSNQGCDFKPLADAATDILLKINKQGNVILANQNAHILGLNEYADSLTQLLPESKFPDFYRLCKQSIELQTPEIGHFRIGDRLYQTHFHPKLTDCIVCFRDITESAEISSELKQVSSRLNFAENIAQLGYWEFDWHHKRIYWSAQMYKIFGLNPQTVHYKRNIFKDYVYPNDLPQYWENLKKLIRHRQPVEGQLRIRRADNTLIYCAYKASIMQDKIAGTFQDITQFIKIQQELEKAKFSAEKANRDKSYFLAQASHDLRQPMQALNIFIATLFEEGLSSRQYEILSKIETSAHNLNNLLNNLLDISNLDAKGVNINKKEFDLYDVIKRIKKEIKYKLQNKDIRFKVVNCHQKIKSDEFLVERILRNFISNAIKYTKNKILVGCLKYQNKIRIMVLDNGIGIDEKEISLIFTPYYQSPNIQDNRAKGSGLGLAIAKKTANALEAEVGVKSEIGKGSNFYIDINFDI